MLAWEMESKLTEVMYLTLVRSKFLVPAYHPVHLAHPDLLSVHFLVLVPVPFSAQW